MVSEEEAIEYHKNLKGKLEIISKRKIQDGSELALSYTPGVAFASKKIAADKSQSYELTGRGNLIVILSNGTRVLGLGDIGPEAAMPVMEGKAVLFKEFGNVNAFPLCINAKTVDEFVGIALAIAPSFGGINLEDIRSPDCFEIEKILTEKLDIPVFHDDQHGTAIAVLAGLYNALKLSKRNLEKAKIVLNGSGAAGVAIAKLLHAAGARNLLVLDSKDILSSDDARLSDYKLEIARISNHGKIKGGLSTALENADVFIGVSKPGLLTAELIKKMSENPVIFALANPTPEIMPEEAKKAGVKIMATGRSDYPNQVNNSIVFPGFFRGLLDSGARKVTMEMKLAAAKALASLVSDKELSCECFIPSTFDKRVMLQVSKSVIKIVNGVN